MTGEIDRGALVGERDYFPLEIAERHRAQLLIIRDKLRQAKYTDETITQTLGVSYSTIIPASWQAISNRYLLDGSEPVHALIRLFCMHLKERWEALSAIFSQSELALLEAVRLLVRVDSEMVRAPVALWPLDDVFIATDHLFETDSEAAHETLRVMNLGGDSCSLALMVRDAEVESALDLCTGSGVIALLASRSCERVTGVDVNPRAVNFSRFNALLNGADNCTFFEGDVFEPVGGERFDLVTANPPYVPTPEPGSLLFRNGGRSGEQVLERVVSGAVDHLTESGVCLIVSSLVEHEGRPYEDKLRQWLRADAGFSCVVFQGPSTSPYWYALRHCEYDLDDPDQLASLYDWVDQYHADNIEHVRMGYLLLARTPEPSVRIRSVPIPDFLDTDIDYTAFLPSLLERRAALDEDKLNERVLALTFDIGQATVAIDEGMFKGLQLPYWLARSFDELGSDGISVDSVLSNLASRGHELGAEEQDELQAFLEYLVLTERS